MNARFWVYINGGPVKITLTPGQSLTWHTSYPSEEGYGYEAETWTLDGEVVVREWANGGRDCDGPIHRSGEDECHLDDLQSMKPFGYKEDDEDWIVAQRDPAMHDVMWPEWQEVAARQRDVYAEAMGY